MKWIHQAAIILDNEEELPVLSVQQRFGAWIIFMSDHREQLGSLGDSMNHLLKITLSYWSGLFHCYQVDNLPKTNNDLEQVFGSFRHHTRRTTGRKKACLVTSSRRRTRPANPRSPGIDSNSTTREKRETDTALDIEKICSMAQKSMAD
ncbi:MAG: hypothetical protein QNJ55_00760 [Xenococcus sp. MO_188.B8]|nr:hypothetical protein [Xenococcus sp. MO_188.B8]